MSKVASAVKDLTEAFKRPRNEADRKSLIADYFENHPMSDSSQAAVRKKLKTNGAMAKLPLRWQRTSTVKRSIYSSLTDLNPIELVPAFFDKGYLSFGSALHWNNLTNQVPSLFYVSKERQTSVLKEFDFDQFSLQDAFMSEPRDPTNLATYRGYKFVLYERPDYKYVGVESRTISIENRSVTFRLTDLERTLLDCAVYPERAGGIANVCSAFLAGAERISVPKLIKYYESYHLTYPHWQVIGLYLTKFASRKQADKWAAHFGKPKFEFYAGKPYKADWPFEATWKVYHPRGVF